MKFVVLALLIATVVGAEISWRPFKDEIQYTYSYEANMEIPNPVILDQTVTLRLECKLRLRLKERYVQITIDKPRFKVISKDTTESPLPVEKVIPEIISIINELKTPFVFQQSAGYIQSLFVANNEVKWILNIKRGIANLFTANIIGKSSEKFVFNHTEGTIFGKCPCLYNVNDTLTEIKEPKMVQITKTIDIDRCSEPLDLVVSSVSSSPETTHSDKPHRSISVMEMKVLRTSSSWKLFSVRANSTVQLYLLGDKKLPISTTTMQRLELIEEEKRVNDFIIPQRKTILGMTVPTMMSPPTLLRGKKLARFVHSTLIKINKLLVNTSTTYTKETTETILELVEVLRPTIRDDLTLVWNKCIATGNPQTTALFVRIFGLVRTEDSIFILRTKLTIDKVVTKELMKEVLLLHSKPIRPTIPMLNEVELLCAKKIILEEPELRLACFLTFVSIRRPLCANTCDIKLPKELTKHLEPEALLKIKKPEEMLQHVLIAETAAEPTLLWPILKIIDDVRIPMLIRKRAVRALTPLVHKMGPKVTNEIMRLLQSLPLDRDDMRLALYSVLLQKPSPSIVHACVERLLKVEKSILIRRFVYERLLAIAVKKDLDIPETLVRESCQFAVSLLRARRAVPINTRWIPPYHVLVMKPITDSNIKLIMKNQMHFVKTSAFPKGLTSRLDIHLLGRKLNVLDLNIDVEGIQDLYSKLVRVASETEPTVEMTALASLSILDQPWVSTYQIISRKEPESILEKALPFWKWSNLANEVTKKLSINTKKTLIPVEVSIRLPTAIGVPLTYNLQTVVMYQLKTSLNPKTPSLFDLPRLAFSNTMMNLTAALKLRSLVTIVGTVTAEIPIVKIGMRHVRCIKTMMNTSMSMSMDLKTMEINQDIQMPKLPEIITTESSTEMLIHQELPRVWKRIIPSHMDRVLHKMDIIGLPTLDKKFYATIHLKVNDKFVTVDGEKIILREEPFEWNVIPAPRNGSIISLHHPGHGFVFVDPVTKKLKISPSERTFFFIDEVDGKIVLKTLVSVPLKTLPTEDEMEKLLAPVLELANILRKEEIFVDEVQRVYRMRDIDPFQSVKVMWVRFESEDAMMVDSPKEAVAITKKIVKTLRKHLECEARTHGICLNEVLPLPVCLYGVLPRKRIIDTTSILYPMFLDISLPDELTNIRWRHVLEKTTEKKISIIKIYNFFSIERLHLEPEELIIKTEIDLAKTNYKLKVQKLFGNKTPPEMVMCSELESIKDSLNVMVSFHPQCTKKHIEITSDFTERSMKTFPRLQMKLNWLLRLESLPLLTKRSIITLVDTFILPKLPSGIERIPMELNVAPLWHEMPVVNGSLMMSLISPELLKIEAFLPDIRRMHWILPLLTRIEDFPIGRKDHSLLEHTIKRFTRPVCKHFLNTFVTFDGLEYKQEIPTPKCERTLVETRPEVTPSVRITFRKESKVNVLKMVVDGAVIEIVPEESTVMPKIKVDGTPQVKSGDMFEITISNKRVLKCTWIPEESSLHLVIRELGIELSLVAGRTIFTRMDPTIFHGRVQGLCGNMDLERFNELETPEHIVIEDRRLFTMTWLVPGTKCSKTGCPFQHTEVQSGEPAKCVPRIGLPICMKGCKSKKSVTIEKVPMKCLRVPRIVYRPRIIPTECTCDC